MISSNIGENFVFPVADGKAELSGGDQVLRNIHHRDNPEREDLFGESDGSPPSTGQDSRHDDGEARNDFWSIAGNYIYRHHVEPRVKLYVPRED